METLPEAKTTQELLMDEALAARAHLATVGAFLVTEAIGEGEPGRDITAHPDYIAALKRQAAAKEALGKFATNI